MEKKENFETVSREDILAGIIKVVEDLTQDWDLEFEGAINAETGLVGDLEFESIDIVEFVVAIEQYIKKRGLPFEELLMDEGRYVDEIKIKDTVDFLYNHLHG